MSDGVVNQKVVERFASIDISANVKFLFAPESSFTTTLHPLERPFSDQSEDEDLSMLLSV